MPQIYILERHDQDDGSITYDVVCYNPSPGYTVCSISDRLDGAAHKVAMMNNDPAPPAAYTRAMLVAKALNFYDEAQKRKALPDANKTNPSPSKVPPRPSRSRSLR